jgi:cation:H+ antiporter
MLLPSLVIIVGFALLVAGGELLLRGAVGHATLLRLPPAVIGLTVVAARILPSTSCAAHPDGVLTAS